MKKIHTLIVAFMGIFPLSASAQDHTPADSVKVIRTVDEMDNRVQYMPNLRLVCIDSTNLERAFGIQATMTENRIDGFAVISYGFSDCNENDEVIFLFENGTKFTQISWNKFNCENNSFFDVTNLQSDALANYPLKKIRFKNGRSFETVTAPIAEGDKYYFVNLYKQLASKQYINRTK